MTLHRLAILACAVCCAPIVQAQETPQPTVKADVQVRSGAFSGVSIQDSVSSRTLLMHDAFTLVLADGTAVRSSDMRVSEMAENASVVDPHRALERVHASTAEMRRCWSFRKEGFSADMAWCVITRPNTNYLRTLLKITAGGNDLPLKEVRMLELNDAGVKVDGEVKGSPAIDANMFFGVEHPLSQSAVDGDILRASIFRQLPLRAGQAITYSAVIGTSTPGQLRRAFLAYLEDERPRAYEPFLHYNSWYDIGYTNRFSEADALDRVNTFGQQLVEKRGVKLDSFLFDDGWDDPNTLWGFNHGFPNGFTRTEQAAAKYGAGIGAWLSPWGGYGEEKKERIAYGRAHGFEIQNDGYALSGPKYYERFEQTCLEMIRSYHVNQFKFDGTGNADRVFPGSAFDSDFDAAIHLIEVLRKQEPELFVNLTTGTTASPFWVFYADSIWRSGEDHDFTGVGSARQRWITYRDAQTYANIVRKGPLYPLNSLMLHGIIYAQKAKDLMTDPGNDFAAEAHTFFSSGTQLQEMYITPSLLTNANWDMLAEAAKWSRANAATLKDTHWIGGDPEKLEVYGWASWSREKGILALRNPSAEARTYKLQLAQVLELPAPARGSFQLHTLWDDGAKTMARPPQTAASDAEITFELAPFESLTIEATPSR
jgi:hypothetical protein